MSLKINEDWLVVDAGESNVLVRWKEI